MDINNLVSPEYIPFLQVYHDAGYGVGGQKRVSRVTELINLSGSSSLLDYGCGQGLLVKALQGAGRECIFAEYDPGVKGKDNPPDGHYDIVTCTDVLEHIEPDRLDNVLDHINSLAEKCIYFIISVCQAFLTLSDDRNAHLIVEPAAWWLGKLKGSFTGCSVIPGGSNGNEIEVIISKEDDLTKKIRSWVIGDRPNLVTDADFFDLWHGESCLIIGSGKSGDYQPFNPALNDFPGKIIGCNSAFSIGYRTDLIMFIDQQVMDKHGDSMAKVDCLKFSIACDPPAPWDMRGNDIHWLLARPPERFSRSFDSGLYPADLTGYLALNTAILMGCNPVWLYGFDGWKDQYFSKSGRFRMAADWAGENDREIYVADKDSYLCSGKKSIFKYKSLPVVAETKEE